VKGDPGKKVLHTRSAVKHPVSKKFCIPSFNIPQVKRRFPMKKFTDLFARLREKHPLVHHITNYVTVNDCANITLAVGAAPVMADAPEEVCEMVTFAGALVLNIGTLSTGQIESMILAGGMANDKKIPVILDPVGAGATRFRTESSLRLLDELVKIARTFAREAGITVVVSGATDIVTDGKRILLVDNGHPMMGSISGTGCMAASVTGACAAVSDDPVIASATAMATFGIAGERAAAGARGPYTFKVSLFDELARLTPEDLASCAKIRIE
jgi:hydroxyethylthiazole kinase